MTGTRIPLCTARRQRGGASGGQPVREADRACRGGQAVDGPERARARRLLAQAARQHWAMRAWRSLSAFVLHHVRLATHACKDHNMCPDGLAVSLRQAVTRFKERCGWGPAGRADGLVWAEMAGCMQEGAPARLSDVVLACQLVHAWHPCLAQARPAASSSPRVAARRCCSASGRPRRPACSARPSSPGAAAPASAGAARARWRPGARATRWAPRAWAS
jgi:hypothetical protein